MTTPPNILVFFCDQLRLDILSCYGGTLVRTPNLDKLAATSLVFDTAYTPTAICSPARASLMTGLYPHGHHMFNNSTPRYSYCLHLRPDATMIQDWADAHTDYETAYFGKWHIGPIRDLFSSRFHHTWEGRSDLPAYTQTNSLCHPNTNMAALAKDVCLGNGTLDIPPGQFPDILTANLTIDFLATRETTRPFLAFCAFPGPHSPWLVPDDFGIRYDPDEIPLWDNRTDSMEGKPLNHRKLQLLSQKLKPDALDDDNLRKLLACQFSYMELIDRELGRVLDALKETGVYDDTLIVFTADHGDMAGAHGYLSKGAYMYDEIYRIPLIVKLSGNYPPRRVPIPVNLMDITATCVHLMAGREETVMGNNELHGESLLPYLRGERDWTREVDYCEYHGDWFGHSSSRMVTDGRWKLVLNMTDTCELYNLKDDPGELKNRFYDPEVKAIRDRYFRLLLEAADRFKDGQVRGYSPEIEDAVGNAFRPAHSAGRTGGRVG